MSILGTLLGIDNEDEKNLKKILKSMRTDMPDLLDRIERLETLIYALSFYHRDEDDIKWRKCLFEAEIKVKSETDRLKTTLRD